MKHTFASLSPQEALEVAISIEGRNAEIYHHFAEMFTEFGDEESLEAASIFWEMSIEERGHHALLQQKYAEQYGASDACLTENELVELIEVPRLNDGDVFAGGDAGSSARARALQVALQAEVDARRFYANLAEHTQAGPLRDIYCDLAEMEEAHVAYLREKLAQDVSETPTVQ